jgi:hypothetical protein
VLIVPPITITDAMLVSSNVSEGPAADYGAGTTYAAGDVVSGVTANPLKVQYASLQSSNTGHTPGASGSETWWRVIGYAADPYDAGTTYPAGESGGGAQIDGDDVHQLWWSAVDDNIGNDPTADAGDHWLLMSPTNRWAMHDLALGFGTGNVRVATRWGELIDNTYEIDEALDSVCAFVLQGASVRVSVAARSYDRTITIEGDPGRVKWQIDDAPHMHKVIFDDVVFTPGDQIRVRIANAGGIAVCAELVFGLAIDAGGTRWGGRVGIQDYSIIAPDDFGTFQVTKRPWHQRFSGELLVAADDLDPMVELLTLKRGSPLLFIGDDDYRSTIIFGIVKSFEDTITWPDLTVMALDLESV